MYQATRPVPQNDEVVRPDVVSPELNTMGEADAWARGYDAGRRDAAEFFRQEVSEYVCAGMGADRAFRRHEDSPVWTIRAPIRPLVDVQAEREAYIVQLARSFPTLTHADGLEPWSCGAFTSWALRNGGSGSKHASRLVLMVWTGSNAWAQEEGLGAFDVGAALGSWDRRHREAFVAWATSPRWC